MKAMNKALRIILKIDPFRIFDFLFYSNYRMAEKIDYWNDTPLLFGIYGNVLPIGLFISAFIFVLDGVLPTNTMDTFKFDKSVLSEICQIASEFAIIYVYYKIRCKSILRKYGSIKLNRIKAALIYFAYSSVCLILWVIAGLFNDREWIFSSLD